MGEGTKYRWQRRKNRQVSALSAREFATFWKFELILLALVLTTGLIGARIILMLAIITSPCAEAVAAFGMGRDGVPVFDRLFTVSVLMGVLWMVLGLKYFRVIWKTKSAVFHVAMLGCILLLMANFRMLDVSENQIPDGTLSTRHVVMDKTSGSPEVFPILWDHDKYGTWHLGRPETSAAIGYTSWTEKCVWLDRNLISATADIEIDGYGKASEKERMEMMKERVGWKESSNVWKPMTIREQMSALVSWLFKKPTPLEVLKERQNYRPLTAEERERFVAKQECLKTNMFSPTRFDDCKYYWGVNYSQIDLDYYMNRDAVKSE